MTKIKRNLVAVGKNIVDSRLLVGDNPVYIVLAALFAGGNAYQNGYAPWAVAAFGLTAATLVAYLVECVFYIDRKDILGVGTELALTVLFLLMLIIGLLFYTHTTAGILVCVFCGYVFPALVNLINNQRY